MTRHVVVLDTNEWDPRYAFYEIYVYRKGETHLMEYVSEGYCSERKRDEALKSAKILVDRYDALLIDHTGED